MTPTNRRQFLARAGRATLAAGAASQLGWLAACGEDPAPEPSGASVESLARMLDGKVVAPGDAGYERAARLFNTRFDGARPRAIAYCESAEDVRRAVEWSREGGVPTVARNGGHSYGGYSTLNDGLVADVTEMNRVEVDDRAGTAKIGAGALLIDVYARLARKGVAIPAGSCPNVGVTGLTLGGGIGLSGRKLGLTCDSLRSATLVTAAGEVVTASEDENPDLLWACKGGGGGNFGIATELTFDVHEVDRVAIYDFQWPWKDARAIFDAWQGLAPDAPDELFSICKLGKPGGDPKAEPVVTSFGQYFGSRAELAALLEPLLAAGRPTQRTLEEMPFLAAQEYWAGCEGGAAKCLKTAGRDTYKAKSHYASEPFPGDAVDTMIRSVERWPGGSDPQGAAIQMDASGGAINRVAPDATAFVHRDDLFHCQYLAFWGASDSQRVVDSNLSWIADFYEAMRPYVSGFAYQNYIDPDLEGWQEAYYGSNYDRLLEVNEKYDPDNFFAFRQSVPPRG